MDGRKKNRARPAYSGPCGAVRALLEKLNPDESMTIAFSSFPVTRKQLAMYASASGRLISKKSPGAKFTTMSVPDGVWVFRVS